MTSRVDAQDPVQVAEAVRTWLADRCRAPVRITETPRRMGEGTDNEIHTTRYGGVALPTGWTTPVVLRVSPSADRLEQLQREATIQRYCVDRGYPAPRVLDVLSPGQALDVPLQVMERVPGRTMLELLLADPSRTGSLVAQLAVLQAELHALPVDAWPWADERRSSEPRLLERRLGVVRDALARGVDPPALGAALHQTERLLPLGETSDAVVCHGDFHPLNVLVAGPTAHVVDWTDAGLCDPHGDLARTLVLFDLVLLPVRPVQLRALLGTDRAGLRHHYLTTYLERMPHLELDPARLDLWERVHLLHDWARAGLARREGRLPVTPLTPGQLGWVRRRLAPPPSRPRGRAEAGRT